MSDTYTYKDYVVNKAFYAEYSEYQKQYFDNARESDKVVIAMAQKVSNELRKTDVSILDVGCSTGNLLYHMKHHMPEARLTGGDLMAYVVNECRSNPSLEGIRFEVMDVCAVPQDNYDIIIVNAVMFLLDWDRYDEAVRGIFASLAPGGAFIGYEWMHGFHSDISITEKSNLHPQGLTINVRPFWRVRESFLEAGFADVTFVPFEIPLDLPQQEGTEKELISRTVRTRDGARLMFRGPLYQPWCHMVARKA